MLLAKNVLVNSCLLCSFAKTFTENGNDIGNIEHDLWNEEAMCKGWSAVDGWSEYLTVGTAFLFSAGYLQGIKQPGVGEEYGFVGFACKPGCR